jgi:hypothetical protein
VWIKRLPDVAKDGVASAAMGEGMIEKQIDDLIEAGWHVLDTDFDAVALRHWKTQAFACLTALLGPDHQYTVSFENYVKDEDKKAILTGGGILSAAKEKLTGNC